MTNKNKAFQATVFSKSIGVTSEVLPFGGDMAICLDDGIVIITKQQAMDFWGLCDAKPSVINGTGKSIDDNIDQEKCPAINGYCKHYTCQYDNNNEVSIEHCTHKDNYDYQEGNCRDRYCPILVKNN